nr:hypothetical protein [Bradyrhizobium yuanmingense]
MPRLARNTENSPDKITFGQMRAMGPRGVLIYCADYRSVAVSADRWPDDLRLSDIEGCFTCTACGRRGADVRPDFMSGRSPMAVTPSSRSPSKS